MYRDLTMKEISEQQIGQTLQVAGWVENIRDHGGVSFIDLRDMYGVLQVVIRKPELLKGITKEMCLSITGLMEHRDEETYNPKIPSGTIELEAHKIDVLGRVYKQLPFEIQTSKEIREDVRLKYRYLDLRNAKVKDNIVFRSKVISYLRQKMTDMGFLEIQTPILCASSPEGARDYIVPSRKFKGKFYALPQAPQQYKQLLMASGFDKYFQIAPCFRDEDARADRSPGEFYQLDFEMSFVTQEDVFKVGEEVLHDTFVKFAPEGSRITETPFPIISYKQAMLEFGCDKPDLRNPLRIMDVTEFFQRCTFKPFIGRTGRAGRKGRSFTFANSREIYKIREIERVCHTTITEKKLPGAAKVLKAKADKYLNKAWELHEHEDIELMKSFLQRKMEEEGCDALELAAAMLKLQVGDKGEEIAADEYTKRGNRFGDRGRSGRDDGEGRSFGRGDGRRKLGREDGERRRFGRSDRDRRDDGSTGFGEDRRRRRDENREDGRKWGGCDKKTADRKYSGDRAEREAKKRKKREEPGIGNSFPKRKRS